MMTEIQTIEKRCLLIRGDHIYKKSSCGLNGSCFFQADVEFLSGLHIMDYSLLLGVHDVDAADEEEDSSPPGSINNGYFLMPAFPGCAMSIL